MGDHGHPDGSKRREGVRIRFGPYLLDESTGGLYCGGERVHVEPKPLELLLLVARRRPQLVSFDEIQKVIWPQVTVARAARDRAISQARHAVGDDGQRQIVIQTQRRRGLRFVARTEDFEPEAGPAIFAPGPSIGDDAPLVGRDRVMESLAGEVEGLARGRGGVVVLEGEAGIGKTRMAREMGTRARRRDIGVHWSRSAPDPEEAGPYWVWRQILRSLLRELSLKAIPLPVTGALEELSGLLPELRPIAAAPAPSPMDGVQVRARLLDAITEVLSAAAKQSPRLLVIDDLHWADADSLWLTRLLAPLFSNIGVLLVVTWREDEGYSQELSVARRELGRMQRRRVHLHGLTRADVAELLRNAMGEEPADALVDTLHQRSDGNAFFVNEMTRVLLDQIREETGSPASAANIEIPSSIALVLDERLFRVSPECRETLQLAAVIGRELELEVLTHAGGWDEEQVNAFIGEAIVAGLIHRTADRPDVARFSHWLVADHLQAPDEPLMPEWHWAVADALEDLHGDCAERWGEIARHRRRGVSAGSPATAIATARRAADHAMALRAHEEASSHLAGALEMMARAPESTDRTRSELLLDLGRCQLRAGRREEAARSFDEAASIARRSGLGDVLARAALGFSGLPSTLSGDHKAQLDRVLEALGRLDVDEASLRARLLSRHASIKGAIGDHVAAEGLAQNAVALARRLNDPSTLASTLRARNAVLVGDVLRAEERITHANESFEHAERIGNEAFALDSQLHRAVALLHRGDVNRFRQEMSQYLARARELRHPVLEYYGALASVTGVILDGRFKEAERRAVAARELGARVEHPDTELYFAIQITQLRFLQGRLHEVLERIEAIAQGTPLLGLRAALALAYAETGREREAGSLLRPLAEDFSESARDSGWLSNVSLLALVAARVRDELVAERLTLLLEPYSHTAVSAFLVSCNGSAAYFLGLLAQTRGRHAEACAHFEAAREANDSMGAVPWLLRTNLALAGSLGGTRRESARMRGVQFAREVSRDAAALEMWSLSAEAKTLVAQLTSVGHEIDPSSG